MRTSTIPRRAIGCLAALLLLAGVGGAARADGLLRLANCRIVDAGGPIKAMGVNYVDGFWNYAKDGKREAYLPYLDALSEAKIPFIRMAFGPWANDRPDAPPAPQIDDFVEKRARYFERLDTFLADLRARHIGAVLDVFWNIDPYAVHFGEPADARARPGSKTAAFLTDTVAELARRNGQDPTIWMVEFLNEGDLDIDFDRAHHTRADLAGLLKRLAAAMRAAGDRHLIDSGNSLPRPAADHLNAHAGWKSDDLGGFLHALDGETPSNIDVASVHIYPEDKAARPWDDGDVMNTLPALVKHGAQSCKPVFIGEFGAKDPAQDAAYIRRVGQSGVQMAAVWGFGRSAADPFAIGLDPSGKALLAVIGRQGGR
jgi:hypothetical protein